MDSVDDVGISAAGRRLALCAQEVTSTLESSSSLRLAPMAAGCAQEPANSTRRLMNKNSGLVKGVITRYAAVKIGKSQGDRLSPQEWTASWTKPSRQQASHFLGCARDGGGGVGDGTQTTRASPGVLVLLQEMSPWYRLQ